MNPKFDDAISQLASWSRTHHNVIRFILINMRDEGRKEVKYIMAQITKLETFSDKY
jgi:hypothetical protein